jgi:hypothetical protein
MNRRDHKTIASTLAEPTMNFPTQRTIFRWIHIIFSIPILGHIYSPFEKLPDYAPATRFVFLPVMILTGIVDVERPHPSTPYFESTGVRRSANAGLLFDNLQPDLGGNNLPLRRQE